MPNAPSTRLPAELTDSIIDHLYADYRSLKICSTVCKTWLPRSRHHLFDDVNVCLQHSNHDSFFQLLDSPRATLVPYVRRLTLRDQRGDKWVFRAIHRLTALTAVKSLVVEQMQFAELQTKTIPALCAAFRGLESLRMYQVSFGSLAHLMNMLSASTSLEHIELSMVEWDSIEMCSTDGDQKAPSRLRSLTLGSNCNKNAVIAWLQFCRPVPSIEVLQLSLIRKAPTQSMCNFLCILGPSLKSLGLGFAATYGDVGGVERAFCLHVNFGAFSQLQTIIFEVPPLYSMFQRFLWVGWIPKVLAQLKSRHLQSIEFNLIINDPKELDVFDWSWMSNAFQQPPFLTLRMLRFWVRGPHPNAVETAIRGKLPDCNARGIISVELPLCEVYRGSV